MAPKILAVASAADLDFRYGCTPAWWQIWKGLYECGADLIVTPYRGRAVESPWWRTAANPLYREAELFAAGRSLAARLKRDRYLRRAEHDPGDTDRWVREVVWRTVTPRWQRHLERLLEREGDVDAVVVFTVPMSHLRGIPERLRERFDVPVVFYDGDVPMSLPEFGGMDTGFNYYHGADPAEYDLVLSNSEGGLERLRELGARRAEAVFWGADPELFAPQPVEKEHDVFFYGYGDKFRRDWMAAMAGATIVSNPYVGIERWFEPGQELVVVSSGEEATWVYRELLADPASAEELGRRARERALDEHTYVHRARQLLQLIGIREQEVVAS